MKLEEIEITIDPDGRIRIETSGFSGESCLKATEDLESLLGNQVVQREFTSGMTEPAQIRSAEKVKIRR